MQNPTRCFAIFVLGLLYLAFPAVGQSLPQTAPEDVGLSSVRLERLDVAMQHYVDENQKQGEHGFFRCDLPGEWLLPILRDRGWVTLND